MRCAAPQFWRDVEQFKGVDDPDVQLLKGKQIYEEYIMAGVRARSLDGACSLC